MAFFNNQDEDKDNAQGMNSQETDANSPTQLTNGVAPISTGAQSQTVSSTPVPKAASSGQTGFQNYQKANQGAATNKLVGAATANVSNQANQAKTNINQATTSFNQKADQGSLANRDTAVTDVKSAVDAARNITAAPVQPTVQPAKATMPTDVFGAPAKVDTGSQLNQPAAPAATTAGAAANPLASLSPQQTSRFQEVINAKYQGPESLRQSGEYKKAAESTANAQTAIDQSATAQGREALLKSLFSQGGNYTQGLNKLDAGILNASGNGVKNLQQVAQSQGNIQGQLDNAQIASANLAQNRTQQINDIRNQSRDAFTSGKTAEELATENRLTGVLDNWNKLPDYFKDIIRNGGQAGGVNLNRDEAGILGIGSGEGFYNLGADAIATGVADKQKLISRDEQARQAALAALGGLDSEKLLNTNLNYGNSDLAGTQSASDALDLAGTRANLNAAEQAFRDSANNNTITGAGSKKNRTTGKRYYAEESANLGDLLRNAGYDTTGAIGTGGISNEDIGNSTARTANGDVTQDQNSQLRNAISPVTNTLSNITGTNIYDDVFGGGIDLITKSNPVSGALGNIIGAVGAPVLNGISSLTGGLVGGGASSKESKNIASQLAVQDLQNKVQEALTSSGFSNRANVVNNDATNARTSALQQLLANLDKTNS